MSQQIKLILHFLNMKFWFDSPFHSSTKQVHITAVKKSCPKLTVHQSTVSQRDHRDIMVKRLLMTSNYSMHVDTDDPCHDKNSMNTFVNVEMGNTSKAKLKYFHNQVRHS